MLGEARLISAMMAGTPRAHGRNEIARRGRVFGARDDRDIADGVALLLKFFALGGEYLVEYRAHLAFDFFPDSVALLVIRRISSITSSALSDSMISRAFATPSASEAALPPI